MKLHVNHITYKCQLPSVFLNRTVDLRIVVPQGFLESASTYKVLLMNDGQDYLAMNLDQTLRKAFETPDLNPFIYVGISCNENRLQEYGIAKEADFKSRGSKAKAHSRFVVEELIPVLKTNFKASEKKEDWVFCGMSLGGLSAFDIAYNHSNQFGKIGVFSGSFWWRKKAFVKGDLKDRSRIVLDLIKDSEYQEHLDFWFQCGTLDEASDRNNNGIIDSIDDTLDVIKELQAKGYSFPGDITYLQVDGGRHDLPTWGKVFPTFLEWAFTR